MRKKKSKLDEAIAAPGTHILINAWMTMPEFQARERVDAAVLAGDTGVYAVRYSHAKASDDLYQALKLALEALETVANGARFPEAKFCRAIETARKALRKAEEEA